MLADDDASINLIFITDILRDVAHDRVAKYTRVIADPRLAKHPCALFYRDVVTKDRIFTYKCVSLDICVISNDRSIFYNCCLVDIFHCLSFFLKQKPIYRLSSLLVQPRRIAHHRRMLCPRAPKYFPCVLARLVCTLAYLQGGLDGEISLRLCS